MKHEIGYTKSAAKYIRGLSDSDKKKLQKAIEYCLGEHLFDNDRRCNKKLLQGSDLQTYRLHVSMTHTVFYRVLEGGRFVQIANIMGINQAHSKYSLFSIF